MSEKQLSFDCAMMIVGEQKWIKFKDIVRLQKFIQEQQATINRLEEDNKRLHQKVQQTREYLQIKIDECKNPKKMKEIVFGVEEMVGYEKALLQFQKWLKKNGSDLK